MKNETRGVAIEEFVRWKPKMYSKDIKHTEQKQSVYLFEATKLFVVTSTSSGVEKSFEKVTIKNIMCT